MAAGKSKKSLNEQRRGNRRPRARSLLPKQRLHCFHGAPKRYGFRIQPKLSALPPSNKNVRRNRTDFFQGKLLGPGALYQRQSTPRETFISSAIWGSLESRQPKQYGPYLGRWSQAAPHLFYDGGQLVKADTSPRGEVIMEKSSQYFHTPEINVGSGRCPTMPPSPFITNLPVPCIVRRCQARPCIALLGSARQGFPQ